MSPNAERWASLERAFEAALEDASTLDRLEDATLRAEVETMLAITPRAAAALRAAVQAEAEQLVTETANAHVGRELGPYRMLRLIGEGGMGAVYLAERSDFTQQVAVKIVARAMSSPQLVARFRDERQILAALVHPNIVRLLDGGSTDEALPYLVMEYVEGTALTTYAAEHGLDVPARVGLIKQVATALQYAHGKLVVHRDIKPGNILVDASGAPKILDFGIAKLLAPVPAFEREVRTGTGHLLFTPTYASPEQVRGDAVATTTDVYSLGAVLFELVTGRRPLEGADPIETLLMVANTDPPRASAVAPTDRRRVLSGDLDNIIAKALRKDPAQRYASMEQLAEDLTRWLDGRPVLARTATLGYRAGKFVRRHKAGVAAAILVVGSLVAGTVVSTMQAQRADRAAEQAAHEADAARMEQQRAAAAEAELARKVKALEAEQTARDRAESQVREKGREVELSREELAAALSRALAAQGLAEEESRRARDAEQRANAAAAAEQAARQQYEALYEKELEHAKRLERAQEQITTKLP